MPPRRQSGFTLLEVLVALVLFAVVLLSMLATGQLVLARLYESDLRLRATLFSQSVTDSLRSTACARLTSGSASRPPLAAAWVATDALDAVRVAVTVTSPQRGNAVAHVSRALSLLVCPEP